MSCLPPYTVASNIQFIERLNRHKYMENSPNEMRNREAHKLQYTRNREAQIYPTTLNTVTIIN